MTFSVVRRVLVSAVALAAAALASAACKHPTSNGGVVSGTDSLTTDATFTGTMFSTSNSFTWADSAEVEVGDLDGDVPGKSMRGLLTFDLPTFASSTISSATLRIYECKVVGTPFATLGTVNVDHVTLEGSPQAGMYLGQTITANLGTIAPDTTVGFKDLIVTSSVQSDISNSITQSSFRLHFSTEDDNNNGVNDYVDFNTAFTGDCVGNPALAPILIVVD
jgi:hypothetical protein